MVIHFHLLMRIVRPKPIKNLFRGAKTGFSAVRISDLIFDRSWVATNNYWELVDSKTKICSLLGMGTAQPEKIKGAWWLPEKPDLKLNGELTYGPTVGAELEVYGDFFNAVDLTPPHRKITIWGETIAAKPVTMFKSLATGGNIHVPGGRTTRFISYDAVLGGHFLKPDDMVFTRAEAKLSGLQDWTYMTGISVQPLQDEHGVSLKSKTPDAVPLGKHHELTIGLEFTSHMSNARLGEYGIKEECSVVLVSDGPTKFQFFRDMIDQVRRFLALGLANPSYELAVKARTDVPEIFAGGISIFNDMIIIRKTNAKVDAEARVLPWDMLFSLKDLEPTPALCFSNFLQKGELLAPACDLFFLTFYFGDMYVGQKLLTLCQAAEAFHRAFLPGKYLSDEQYQATVQTELLAAVPQTLDPDFKLSLKNKLKYLHEFSLRKRLLELCNRAGEFLVPLIGDFKNFASLTSEKRNAMTHSEGKKASEPAPELLKLWLTCQQLSILLETCILQELGFTPEKLKQKILNSPRARAIGLNLKR
jgi:hypothetical protein